MPEQKRIDMSETCGHHYDEYWNKTHIEHTMSEDEFQAWFNQNCAQCICMSDICMYGEGVKEDADG